MTGVEPTFPSTSFSCGEDYNLLDDQHSNSYSGLNKTYATIKSGQLINLILGLKEKNQKILKFARIKLQYNYI